MLLASTSSPNAIGSNGYYNYYYYGSSSPNASPSRMCACLIILLIVAHLYIDIIYQLESRRVDILATTQLTHLQPTRLNGGSLTRRTPAEAKVQIRFLHSNINTNVNLTWIRTVKCFYVHWVCMQRAAVSTNGPLLPRSHSHPPPRTMPTTTEMMQCQVMDRWILLLIPGIPECVTELTFYRIALFFASSIVIRFYLPLPLPVPHVASECVLQCRKLTFAVLAIRR